MKIKILCYLFFIIFLSYNINSNILYDKDDIIVTDIDIQIYIKLYKDNYRSDINTSNSLKDLVLIKHVIRNLSKNNPEFIKRIDKEILNQYGLQSFENDNIREFLRFSKIRDEFIINYFQSKLDINEIKNIFKNLDNLNLPISDKDCLIIKEVINLQYNEEFIENLFKNLKNNTKEYLITINGNKYNVCIDQKIFQNIEKLIVEYIQSQTDEEFERFVYGKISD